MRARQSPLPVAKCLPEGLTATLITEFLCPCNIRCVAAVRGSLHAMLGRGVRCSKINAYQNWTERSFEPEISQLPSGEKATDKTKSCFLKISILAPWWYKKRTEEDTLWPLNVDLHRERTREPLQQMQVEDYNTQRASKCMILTRLNPKA